MSSIRIKTVLGNDIRRIEVRVASFDNVVQSVREVYGLSPSTGVVVSYEDEEGDNCRISTSTELAEALQFASEQKRHLKLFIRSTDSVVAPVPAQVPEQASPKTLAPEVPVAAAVPEPNHAEANHAEAKETKTNEEELPSLQELPSALFSFLSDPQVLQALPQLLQVAVQAIREGESAETIIQMVVASSDAVAEHSTVKRLMPLLPFVAPRLNEALAALRAMPQLEMYLQMAPLVLPCIRNLLPSLLSSLGNHEDPSAACGGLSDLLSGFGLPAGNLPAFASMFDDLFEVAGSAPCAQSEKPATSSSSSTPSTSGPDVHQHVTCDGCGVTPISGTRYKCSVCADYDLCEACEAKDVHPVEHPLVKIRHPASASGVVVHQHVRCDGCQSMPIQGVRFKCSVCPDYDLCEKCEAKGAEIHPEGHPLIKMKVPRGPFGRRGWGGHHGPHGPRGFHGPFGPGGRHGGVGHHGPHGHHGPFGGWGGRRGGCGRKWGGFGPFFMMASVAEPTPSAPAAESNAAGAEAVPTPQVAALDAKVTSSNLADDSVVSAGQSVVKVWRVINCGSQPWPEGVKLIFVRGDEDVTAAEEFPVASVKPGELVEVVATLNIPADFSEAGVSVYYQLATPDRSVFGPRLAAKFVVAPAAPAASSLSASSSALAVSPSAASTASATSASAPVESKRSSAPSPSSSSASASAPALESKQSRPEPSPEVVEKYGLQLQLLSSMGFQDRDTILALLEKHSGDVTKTYKELLAIMTQA